MVAILSAILIGFRKSELKSQPAVSGPNVEIYHFGHYGEQPESSNPFRLRMLILKHCKEAMADGDANLAIAAVDKGKKQGLDVQVVGNQQVEGLEGFAAALRNKIQTNASPGDTLIVHTIGHGMPGGQLVTLGQRRQVSKILAEAAVEFKQEIIWWQLSCYAASELPPIGSMSAEEQKVFSNLASASATELSPAYDQGYIMAKVFVALAEKNKSIDPNGDGVITASELKAFLNGLDQKRRGDLFFSRSPEEPIFGRIILPAMLLPIINRNGEPRSFSEDFVPLPRKF